MKYFEMKKRAFMSIVNAVKGFIRKVSGTPPITLPDCVDDDSLISYSLGLEDTRVNLYKSIKTSYNGNGITITRNADGTYTVNGTATDTVYFHIGDMLVDTTKMYYLSGGTENAYLAVRQMCNGVSQNSIISKGNGALNIPTSYYHITIDTFNPIIYIPSGNICDNEIIKPMISHIETDEYVPYVEPETLGDKTKNLFDKNTYSYTVGYYSNQGVYTPSSSGLTAYTNNYCKVMQSTTYHCSSLGGEPNGANTVAVYFYNANREWISKELFSITSDTLISGYTFNTPADCHYVRFQICLAKGTITGFDAETFMLNEGTDVIPYEPFGYKIPIKMSGKNLFDYDNQTWITGLLDINYGGVNTSNTNYKTTDFIKILEAEKDYVVSFTATYVPEASSQTSNRVCFYDELKNFIGYANINVGYEMKRYKYDVKVPKDTKYIRYSARITDMEILIEEGTAATDYEPYINPITTNIILDEPLIAGNVLEYPKDNIPKLPTVKGTTIYSVETEVQPSNMSVEYYATRKGE